MAIEPNTTIKLYHNVRLDASGEYTVAWETIAAQNSYFHANNQGILKYTFTSATYQRVNKGVLRVEQKADDLYDCNYMAFQNTNYGNKWFYAFITRIEYVNDKTSEISYEIDQYQTWFNDIILDPTMIERCHTTTDEIGDHIEPEPVQLGEYVMNYTKSGSTVVEEYKPLYDMSSLDVIIAIVDVTEATSDGKLYDNIYGAAKLCAYNQTDVSHINGMITHYLTKPDSIISIYMCPAKFIRDSAIPDGGIEIPSRSMVNGKLCGPSSLTASARLDGYLPRNKKLYTYPYNYYHVDNSCGSSLAIRYEFCEGLRPRFEITGTITQPVEAVIKPYAYKNCTSDPTLQVFQQTLNTEVLTINTFPMCSWNTDGFQAYMVQNGIPYGINAIGSAIDMVTGLALGGLIGAAGGGTAGVFDASGASGAKINMGASLASGGLGSKLASTANLFYAASTTADICKGNFSNASADCASGKHQFYGGRCSITHQYARIIDDFFDKYGYAVRRLETPNPWARPHWTYIKTDGCQIRGNVPTDAREYIKKMYNNGCTFWRNPNEVGNYTLDNRV